jgi:pyrophosphatase PpaX
VARLPWRSVLFDLDGTLVDTIDLIVASHRHAITTVLGRDLPDDVLRGGIGRPLLEQMSVFDPERAQELYDTYRVWNHANTERLLRRYDGVDEVLGRLHAAGAAIGVVTSKSRDAVELAQRILPPPVPFDAVVTAEDTERHKPGPEPILHALELLGGTPADAVYVGDARYDVMAARAAGTAAVAVTWGAGHEDALREAGPDAIVGSPAELAEVLGLGGPEGA